MRFPANLPGKKIKFIYLRCGYYSIQYLHISPGAAGEYISLEVSAMLNTCP